MALHFNTDGTGNTAIGAGTLLHNTIGTTNTATGVNALNSNTTGGYNSALGMGALLDNTTGSNNTAIGYWAGLNNNGSGNVFIGYKSGLNASGASNQLYIANAGGVPLIYGDFSSDRVGINTATPAASLDVNGTAMFTTGGSGGPLTIGTPQGQTGICIGQTHRADIRFNDNYLLIGARVNTSPPDIVDSIIIHPYDVGGAKVGIGSDPGSSSPYKLDVAGSVHATSFPSSSDARFKSNVHQLVGVLDKLRMVRGVSFEWNELYNSLGRSTGRKELGLIAQEIEKVFPELVTRWGDEDYRAVDYGRFTAVLLEAIKEQQSEIESLKKDIAEIKAR